MSLQAVFVKMVLRYLFKDWPIDVEEQRMLIGKYIRFTRPSRKVVTEEVEIGRIRCEWISTQGVDDDRVLFHLHGGAYVFGSINAQRPLIANLGKAGGMRAFAIDLPMAPEHPFPLALEDTIEAFRWLLDEEVDPLKVIISGDSSGAGLALAALVSFRDAGLPLPAGAVCLSPWTDLALTGDSIRTRVEADIICDPEIMASNAKHYAGGRDLKDPLISPLYADLGGLPPTLIHVGTDEIMLDDSTRVAERAQQAGVDVTLKVWEGMWHVFQMYADMLPEARKSIKEIGAFMRERVR